MNVYVYYKVPDERREALRPVASALLDAVRSATGIQGRWMRRRDDPANYMEVYENVGNLPAFEIALDAAVQSSGFTTLVAHRVTEIFQPA